MSKADLDKMLQDMFAFVLTEAEIKAIVKNRGLPKSTANSRELLRQAFLGQTGLDAVIVGLSQDELLLLNLILVQGDVDSRVPALLYDPSARERYGTFPQMFARSAKETRSKLVRKGILGVSVLPKGLTNKSVCERTRFFIPEQIAVHLPTSLATSPWDDEQEEHDDRKFRRVLEELVRGAGGPLSIKSGVLMHITAEFSIERMQLTLMEACQREFTSGKKGLNFGFSMDLPIIETMMAILGRLGPDEGVAVSALEPLSKFLLSGQSDWKMPDLCEAMFNHGLLAKQKGNSVYRLRKSAATDFRQFIRSMNDRQVVIDHYKIGVEELGSLAKVSTFSLNNGSLIAKPDLVRLSHHRALMDASPFLRSLGEHHKAYRETIDRVDERRDRTFVHDNLLIAHITDLTLRVAVQKGLRPGRDYVQLEDEWFAFPQRFQSHIHAAAQKLGHAVRDEIR